MCENIKYYRIKVLEGREAAIEVATQQNAKLLTLLQQNETKVNTMGDEKEVIQMELKEIKNKYIKSLR